MHPDNQKFTLARAGGGMCRQARRRTVGNCQALGMRRASSPPAFLPAPVGPPQKLARPFKRALTEHRQALPLNGRAKSAASPRGKSNGPDQKFQRNCRPLPASAAGAAASPGRRSPGAGAQAAPDSGQRAAGVGCRVDERNPSRCLRRCLKPCAQRSPARCLETAAAQTLPARTGQVVAVAAGGGRVYRRPTVRRYADPHARQQRHGPISVGAVARTFKGPP